MRRARRVSASGVSSCVGSVSYAHYRCSASPRRRAYAAPPDAAYGTMERIMIGFTLLLFPFVLLGFVMLMGRVEEPLSQIADRADEIEKFLEDANRAELDTFVREGTDSALRRFRNRLLPSRRRTRLATTAS